MTAQYQGVPQAPEKSTKEKIHYINHLKVFLTALVVIHHAFITYGAPGGWYFQQKTSQVAALFPMTVFVSTNQSFFMGFYFFLSALFVESSYQKKGGARFLTDRLKRLGLPLAFYSLVISPVLNYTVEHYGYGQHHSFSEYMSGYHHWIDFGVMWFVAALLLFNIIYLFFKSILALRINAKCHFLSTPKLLLAAFILGLFTFLTRLVFPVGWVLYPVGFQLGHFPQYILLFIVGIIASKNNWLSELDLKQGKVLLYAVLISVFIILPASFILKLVLNFPGDYFSGGWNWVSLFYSLWEQITGVMIMVVLLSFARFKWNRPSAFWSKLSGDAFGVYIFHPLVLVGLSLMIRSSTIDPVIKLVIIGPSAVALSFVLISWLRKIRWISAII